MIAYPLSHLISFEMHYGDSVPSEDQFLSSFFQEINEIQPFLHYPQYSTRNFPRLEFALSSMLFSFQNMNLCQTALFFYVLGLNIVDML